MNTRYTITPGLRLIQNETRRGGVSSCSFCLHINFTLSFCRYPFDCCPGYTWNYNSNVCERKSSMNKLNLFTADKISNDSEII